MSSNRRSLASRSANEGEINELILKLQALLPDPNHGHLKRVSRADVLKEVCNYMKKLDKEIDDMSSTISQMLASADHNITSLDADVLSTLAPFVGSTVQI
ncbi:unnamed protein product [Amaranthus hypochondriacus]